MDRLVADVEMTDLDFRVFFAVTSYCHEGFGFRAWPAHGTVAEKIGRAVKTNDPTKGDKYKGDTVRRSVRRLCAKGYLAKVEDRGRGRTCSYALGDDNRTLASGIADNSDETKAFDRRVEENRTLASEKPDPGVHENRTLGYDNSPLANLLEQHPLPPPAGAPSAPAAAALDGESREPPPQDPDLNNHRRVQEAKDNGIRRHVQSLVDEMGVSQAEAWSITMKMLDGDGPPGAWRDNDQFLHYESVAGN
tara:strand:- start:40422 stop:41168 length:747 start_codon:yes stop_codon:yes gene_type:complete